MFPSSRWVSCSPSPLVVPINAKTMFNLALVVLINAKTIFNLGSVMVVGRRLLLLLPVAAAWGGTTAVARVFLLFYGFCWGSRRTGTCCHRDIPLWLGHTLQALLGGNREKEYEYISVPVIVTSSQHATEPNHTCLASSFFLFSSFFSWSRLWISARISFC